MPSSIALISKRPQLFKSPAGEPTFDLAFPLPTSPKKTWEVVIVDSEAAEDMELQQQIKTWSEKFSSLEWIYANPSDDLEKALRAAQEKSRWKTQSFVHEELLIGRKKELEEIEKNLLLKLEKKNKMIRETRKRLFWAANKQELLKKCLMTLQEAETVEIIENQLLRILTTAFELSWIKILPSPEDKNFCDDIEKRIDASYHRLPLFAGQQEMGSFIAVKVGKLDFKKEQLEFLKQLGEAISMALIRMNKLKNTLDLQQQWESTFYAIPYPILMIHENYDIIQMNQKTSLEQKKKCYEFLFDRSEPCEHCSRGKKFLLENSKSAFEVLSQEFFLEDLRRGVFVNTYIDITEKSRIQKKMIESAKMAELGMIGGSIAHEINNPLGGLLSYIQLLRMELSPDDPRTADLAEMEKAAQRCILIVRQLLEVSRF